MNRGMVIGSRGSRLALTQAEWVKTKLALLAPDLAVQIDIIKTTGDVKTEPLSVIGGKGVFTKELEDALLDRRIDIAVHSLKDLPTIIPEGLMIAAICERADPRDALVLRSDGDQENATLATLTDSAVVGTSSQRRLAQLKHLRRDVIVKDVRGNVDTRLRKLDEGEYHALILASAGLRRMGLEKRISALIATDQMLPAVGQGAIGLETRADDKPTIGIVSALNHKPTAIACAAERSFLSALGGGCQLPIAGYAVLQSQELTLEGLVGDIAGEEIVRDRIVGPSAEADEMGKRLATRLLTLGAKRLLTQVSES